SERDDNEVIYNLFGEATWVNLHALNMFRLKDLELLVGGEVFDKKEVMAIKDAVYMGARIFSLEIPNHWLVFLD
ncbi:hypothetical protein WBU38_005612, partial [Escherichia coli]